MANVKDRIHRTTATRYCFDCQRETRTVVTAKREWAGAPVQATVCKPGTGCKAK